MRVIFDNGFIIGLIRPLRDHPNAIGEEVEVMVVKSDRDIVKFYDSLTTDVNLQKAINGLVEERCDTTKTQKHLKK